MNAMALSLPPRIFLAQPQRLVTLDMRDFGRPEVQQMVNFLIQTPRDLLADIRRSLIQGLR